MECAGHGGPCGGRRVAAVSGRGSCVGILRWDITDDRDRAWVPDSCAVAVDFCCEKTKDEIGKAHFVVIFGLWIADIVVQKINQKKLKKIKKSVDKQGAIWYIN